MTVSPMMISQMKQIANMLQNGNPQTVLTNIVKQKASNNPLMNNALNLMNSGNTKELEQLVRNVCAERGINPDEYLQVYRNI